MTARAGSVGSIGTRWFWPIWLGGFLLAVAVTLAARASAHFPGDVRTAQLVQALEWPGEDTLVQLENVLGSGLAPALVMLLATFAFLLARRFVACLALLFSSALRFLSTALKAVAERPRPAPSLIEVNERATGYSFPSGHVITALLLYGAIAVLVAFLPLPRPLRLVVRCCCLAIVLLMGFARIDVGAHWPSDVLGGYLWGGLALSAILRLLVWPNAARRASSSNLALAQDTTGRDRGRTDSPNDGNATCE